MTTDFHKSLTALFRRLGLEAGPEQEVAKPAFLTIDEFEVEFDESEDETAIRCSVIAGAFSGNSRVWPDQMRKVLKQNMALARDSVVCASIDGDDPERRRLMLQFALPYRSMKVSAFADQLNEMINRAEFYQQALEEKGGGLASHSNDGFMPAEAIIFRP